MIKGGTQSLMQDVLRLIGKNAELAPRQPWSNSEVLGHLSDSTDLTQFSIIPVFSGDCADLTPIKSCLYIYIKRGYVGCEVTLINPLPSFHLSLQVPKKSTSRFSVLYIKEIAITWLLKAS